MNEHPPSAELPEPAERRRIIERMDRWTYAGLGSRRKIRSREPESEHLVPQGQFGAGQWTGHPVGLLVVAAVLVMVLVGIPEARTFLVIALLFGAVLGWILWLRHR